MEDLKGAARRAKKRLKTGYWQKCREDVDRAAARAGDMGLNAGKVRSGMFDKVRSDVRGQKPDEFYLRVKELLDDCGEVSDAIGRLTDRKYYESLSYEEKQRYTLQLSARYLKALERYRAEKQSSIPADGGEGDK